VRVWGCVCVCVCEAVFSSHLDSLNGSVFYLFSWIEIAKHSDANPYFIILGIKGK